MEEIVGYELVEGKQQIQKNQIGYRRRLYSWTIN